jgi:hypothetical protein
MHSAKQQKPAPRLLHRRNAGARRAQSAPVKLSRSLGEYAAAARLTAAGLVDDDHGFLGPTPRAEATIRGVPDRRWLR